MSARIRTARQARKAREQAELNIFAQDRTGPRPTVCDNCAQAIAPGSHVHPNRWERLRDHIKECAS